MPESNSKEMNVIFRFNTDYVCVRADVSPEDAGLLHS